MFSGKLGVAQTAYQNSDDSGQQSIGQLTGMLGPVGQQAGQLGQSVGSPAQALGGQTGMFGSLMQQAMQAAQGGGGGQSAGGQAAGGQAAGGQAAGGAGGTSGVAGQGSAGVGGHPQQPRDDAIGANEDQKGQAEESQHDERETLQRADTDDRAMAGPSGPEDGRHGAGPVPVTPPEQPRHSGDDDIARRM